MLEILSAVQVYMSGGDINPTIILGVTQDETRTTGTGDSTPKRGDGRRE